MFMTNVLRARIAFLGCGNMGKYMAANIIRDPAHKVVVFDVSPKPLAELEALGATVAPSVSDAAKDVDVVITMLPTGNHVKDVYTNGVFRTAKPGTLLIDCSTIEPATSRSLASLANEKKMRMVDAPVSGGVRGAEAGTLTFMVGGEKLEFEESKLYLSPMGKNIVHVGGAGAGQIAKICNNLILGISMTAVSEAMNLGVKLGADPNTLAAIINTSSGRCWSSEVYNPVPGVVPSAPASRGYNGGFGASLMSKDLGLALEAAKSVAAPLPTGSAAFATYQMLLNQNMGGKDFSAIYAFLQGQKLD